MAATLTTFEKAMRDARTQATEFPKKLKEYERILELVANNGIDTSPDDREFYVASTPTRRMHLS